MRMRTQRLVAAVSGGLLATAIMTGCGDSGDDGGDEDSASGGGDYCGQVEEMKGEFETFGSPDATLSDISSTVDLIGDISESAPDDISGSWESLHSALSGVESGLSDLGIEKDAPMQEAVAEYAGKDQAKQKKVLEVLSGTEDVQSDGEKIDKQVKKECDIELSGSSEDAPEGSEDGGS